LTDVIQILSKYYCHLQVKFAIVNNVSTAGLESGIDIVYTDCSVHSGDDNDSDNVGEVKRAWMSDHSSLCVVDKTRDRAELSVWLVTVT